MEEEKGLTLSDILKVIFKKIWWVLGATALGIIAVVLLVELWYNKQEQYYQVNYEIVYPDSISGKYPDGNDFLISESISAKTLSAIKESSGDYASIDINKMLQKDAITVSESIVKEEDDSVKHIYKMTVIAKYFKNDEQAVKFLRAAASYPVERVLSITENKEYGLFFETFDSAKTYEEKIHALSDQKDYLIERYEMLKLYEESVETNIATLRNVFTENEKKSLTDRIDAYFYVLDTKTFKDDAQPKIEALRKQIADNEKVIQALRDERDRDNAASSGLDVDVTGGVWTNSYDYQISQLIIKNQEMQNEIDNVQKKLDAIALYETAGSAESAKKKEFEDLLLKYRNEMETATNKLKEVSVEVYGKNSSIIYSGNRVEKDGGMSAIVAALIGAVAGFAVASIVICIIDLPKYIKNKKAAETVNEGAAEGDGQSPESVNE